MSATLHASMNSRSEAIGSSDVDSTFLKSAVADVSALPPFTRHHRSGAMPMKE